MFALNLGCNLVLHCALLVWAAAKRSVASIRGGVLDQQRFLRGKMLFDTPCRRYYTV